MTFPIPAVFHPAVPEDEGAVEKSKVVFLNSEALPECYYKSQILSQQAVCDTRLSVCNLAGRILASACPGDTGELRAKLYLKRHFKTIMSVANLHPPASEL